MLGTGNSGIYETLNGGGTWKAASLGIVLSDFEKLAPSVRRGRPKSFATPSDTLHCRYWRRYPGNAGGS
jgi:hypothetical protein